MVALRCPDLQWSSGPSQKCTHAGRVRVKTNDRKGVLHVFTDFGQKADRMAWLGVRKGDQSAVHPDKDGADNEQEENSDSIWSRATATHGKAQITVILR